MWGAQIHFDDQYLVTRLHNCAGQMKSAEPGEPVRRFGLVVLTLGVSA
jgi:hypothetical protein